MNLDRFDDALDKAKEMATRLEDSEVADIVSQLIHAIDLLADVVVKSTEKD